ncbi:MAG TPA: VWA domain-containing protein [Vicinamibacteria bacterium]|nr:VWA domain-containing protein [Vicinamibacteria bacterium]
MCCAGAVNSLLRVRSRSLLTGVPFVVHLLPITLSCWFGALGAQAADQPAPRFETRVEVVKVSVLVHGAEGPILGLRSTDFEVRDNGVPQALEGVVFEELPLNVILDFDVSGSMNFDVSQSVKGQRMTALKSAAHALVAGLRPGDQAALLTFATMVRLRQPLTSDLTALHTRINALEGEGGTSLVDGTFSAIALGDAVPGRVLAVVFTDGQENTSWLRQSDVLDAAKRSEVVVYGVRVGGEDSGFLDDVASTTGGRRLQAGSPEGLQQAFLEILREFRTRYLLRYTPRGIKREGWHRLDVRVKGRPAKVLLRKGYLVTP